jgi:PAS domain S-box-containing protein
VILRRYLLALGWAAVATIVSKLLEPHWTPIHLLLPFYPAVMLSAWFGGLGPGLLNTIVASLIINYYWLPPINSLGISDSGDWVGMVLFLGVGLLISSVSERMLRAQRRAEAVAVELGRQVDERARAEKAAARLATLAEELRTSAERYRLQVERNLAGVFRAQRDGRLVEASDAFAKLLGYRSREDVLARSARDFFSQPGGWQELVASLAPGVVISNHEVAWTRSDGAPLAVLLNVREADGLVEALAIDITDRKRAEEAERQAVRLRAVADLAAAAAHEISHPLAVIVANLSGLRPEGELAPRVEQTLEAARRIQEIVERMTRIDRVRLAARTSPDLPTMLDIRKSSD